MSGQFVLRTEGDTTNPYAARLYGLGLTQGRTVFYLPGSRTTFLAILAQGARFRGDLGCSKAIRVYYAGFELAEFDEVGTRQWRFHKGKVSGTPDYRVIEGIAGGLTFQSTGHGFVTGDPIAFHARGTDVNLSSAATVHGTLTPHTVWPVWRVDNDHFKVLAQAMGETPVEAEAFTAITCDHPERLFVFDGDQWLFDPTQGKPEFFPGVEFTFSGLSYIEVRLPTHLSDGEDEPQNLKVILEGKEMYDIEVDGQNLAFTTDVIARPNNALILADTVINDAKRPLSRLNGPDMVAFRDRCDATIPWDGGADMPAIPLSFPTSTNVTYDAAVGKITKTGGSTSWDAYVATEQFDHPNTAICEFRYTGGDVAASFATDNTGEGAAGRQGIRVTANTLFYSASPDNFEIMPVAVGDKLKIAYENGLLVIYRNGVPLPMVQNTYTQLLQTFYIDVRVYTPDAFVDQLLIAPSGTNSAPRQITRFEGGMVASQPIGVADAIEAMLHLAPGCSWGDYDGQIHIAVEPDRTPCFTFIHDPSNPATKSNVAKVTVKRKSMQDTFNFWTYMYRDSDDPILAKKFVPIDRKERRVANGGKLSFAGAVQYGVLNQSQMERIGETRARIESDFDIGFTVEAFLDSLTVTKGSFVYLVDPTAGYTAADPALCQVIDERLSMTDIETRVYELQIVTPEFYSDTDHGAVIPGGNNNTTAPFIPPQPAQDLVLSETTEPMPDGRYLSSISGVVTFGTGAGQFARVFNKVLTARVTAVTLNSGTDVFTSLSGAPDSVTPLILTSSSGDMPTGSNIERTYYAVNQIGNDFQLSLEEGGSPENFGSSGADLVLYEDDGSWIDTGIVVTPDGASSAAFEIIPARKSVTLVRVQTFSSAGVTLPFSVHLVKAITVSGDLLPPAPPSNASFTFDGVRLMLHWSPSPTFGISGYIIYDELNRLIAQVSGNDLSFVSTANADRVTRRIYAVNSTGILSSTYAEVTWVRAEAGRWINPNLLTINADNSLTVGGKASFAARALFNRGIVTDHVAAILSVAPDRNDIEQIVGFTYTTEPAGVSDYEFALHFKNDGTFSAYFGHDAADIFVDTYEPNDELWIQIVPQPVADQWSEVSRIQVCRRTLIDGVETIEELFIFNADFTRHSLMYVATNIGTDSVTSQIHLQLTGDVVDAEGEIPATAQNLVSADYDSSVGLLQDTAGSGFGFSGANFPFLAAHQEGAATFKISANHGDGYAVGLNTDDSDQDITSMPYYAYINDSFEVNVFIDHVDQGTGPTVSPGDTIWIGRENGVLSIRVNGMPQPYYDGGDIIDSDVAMVLDFALRSGAHVEEIALHPALVTGVNGDGTRAGITVDTKQTAQVGANRAIDIPPFQVTDPTVYGEVLAYDSTSQKWVNRALVSSDISGLGTMAVQNASSVAITGGSISGVTFGTIAGGLTVGSFLWVDGGSGTISGTPAGTVLTLSQADGVGTRILVDTYSSSGSVNNNLTFRVARGSRASKSAIQNNDIITSITSMGYGTSNYQGSAATIKSYATETWTNTAIGTRWGFATTATGGNVTTEKFFILGSGGVIVGTAITPDPGANNLWVSGVVKAGSAPTTLTDSAGKILSASLNTVAIAQGGTNATAFTTNGITKFDGTRLATSSGFTFGGTFGYLEISTSTPIADAAIAFNVDFQHSVGSSLFIGFDGVRSSLKNNSSGATVPLMRAIYGTVTSVSGATVTTAQALSSFVNNPSGSTMTNAQGLSTTMTNAGSATTWDVIFASLSNSSTITTASLATIRLTTNSGGTITTLRGVNISGWGAAGTVTTSYGIYMDASIDVGATKWALYSSSTSPSLLSGRLGLGGTPQTPFHTFENTVDGGGIRIENAAAAGSPKYGFLGQMGTTGFSVASWPSAFVIEGAANGGVVIDGYGGDVIVQRSRVNILTISSGGITVVGAAVVGSSPIKSPTTSVIFFGTTAGANRVSGSYQTGIGLQALGGGALTGDDNTALGTAAGYSTTSGYNNLYIGYAAGLTNATGIQNVYIGSRAGYYQTSDYNVFIGTNAGLGAAAGASGSYNTGISFGALASLSTGIQNTCIGGQSGQLISTGYYNVGIGVNTLVSCASGTENVAIGHSAGISTTGIQNVYLGAEAGRTGTSASNCIAIGFQAGYSNTTSNRLYIENSSSATPLIYGEFDNKIIRVYGRLGARATTEQMRLEYDASNYMKITVGSTGIAAVDAVGSAKAVQFASGLNLGFFGATAVAQQTVTGSRGGNAALASLLTQLATLGLIVDSSS